ncbi:N-acetylmuramoyl-L-alanine amidase [Xanthobacter autotrophicus]|uniref:N-acetylmuramoyl-L-alanine amidase n=1 Tax=Xanthobacter TaxID=279 RepID=UPI0024AC7D5D|nr:N-acetylmuramoyl-L-alanine amidase [Xanthobacter autotrophicus]MDI4666423.1 N-acetylmuramoyl-L-alanine amidase [Xanthobacter autotrophicus]
MTAPDTATPGFLDAPDSPWVDALLPSPNFGPRKAKVDMLVLHYTGMASAEAAIELLRAPGSEVSCHYVVREDGSVVQMVAEAARAWHAGRSCWEGISDTNSRSIGIEIVNGGHDFGLPDFPAAQIAAVIALCADIVARHGIRADRVLAHSDVAPARKRDPGENFPWAALHAAGIGHLVAPSQAEGGRFLMLGDAGAPVAALKAMLALYGYDIELTDAYDAATAEVVAAFQRHFRPAKVDGVADAATILTLRDLIATRPGDVPEVA